MRFSGRNIHSPSLQRGVSIYQSDFIDILNRVAKVKRFEKHGGQFHTNKQIHGPTGTRGEIKMGSWLLTSAL